MFMRLRYFEGEKLGRWERRREMLDWEGGWEEGKVVERSLKVLMGMGGLSLVLERVRSWVVWVWVRFVSLRVEGVLGVGGCFLRMDLGGLGVDVMEVMVWGFGDVVGDKGGYC